MAASEWLSPYLARYRQDAEYLVERLLLDINEQIVERMQSRGLRRSELAGRMGVSRAFVTQLLRGNPNITLRTLVKLTNALDLALDVRLAPKHLRLLRAACAHEFPRRPLLVGAPQGRPQPDESAIAA
jgi:transcriptional regulator with XRE-family HTH domain